MSSRSILEQLPNEVQLMFLKYLTVYDLYSSFFGLNRRFNGLIKHLTPTVIKRDWPLYAFPPANQLIQESQEQCDRSITYYLIPRLMDSCMHWSVFTARILAQLKFYDQTVLKIIEEHCVQLNLLILTDYWEYRFDELVRIVQLKKNESWLQQHYLKYYLEMTGTAGAGRHGPISSLQKEEFARQLEIMKDKAQLIWQELTQIVDADILKNLYYR